MRGFGGFVTFNYISVIFQRVTVKHGGETRTGLYGGTDIYDKSKYFVEIINNTFVLLTNSTKHHHPH